MNINKYTIINTGTTITVGSNVGMTYTFNEGSNTFLKARAILEEYDLVNITVEDINEMAERMINEVYNNKHLSRVQDEANKADIVIDNEKAVAFLESVGVEREDGMFYIGDEEIEEGSPLLGVILSLLVDGEDNFDSKKNFLSKLFESHFDLEQITQICNFMLGKRNEGTNAYNLTEDGNFMLYRSVRNKEWGSDSELLCVDHHSGNIPQPMGWTITMPANLVDKDPNNTCSHGLHVATLNYAEGFGSNSTIQLVEVDPRDIISVPTDYNYEKVRTSKYKIIGFLDDSNYKKRELPFDFLVSTVNTEENGNKVITVGRGGKILKVEK